MTKAQHDSETKAQGQQVITAVAFIYRKNNGVYEVFLAKRASTKKFLPNKWEMVGGHIDYGEDIVDGLIREVKEELEIDVIIGEPFAVFTYLNNIKGSHSIEVVYFAQLASSDHEPVVNPEDHSEVRWMSRENVVAERKSIIAEADNPGIDHNAGTDPEYEALLKGFETLEKTTN